MALNLATAAALSAATAAAAELLAIEDAMDEDGVEFVEAGGRCGDEPFQASTGTVGGAALRGGCEIGGGWHVILSDSPGIRKMGVKK